MNGSYWFYIEPYVHISVKGGNALFYNTLNGKLMEYDNPIIVKLIKKLKSKKNLLVIKLTGKELADAEISKFVKEVREFYSGDLIDTSYSKKRPIQLLPQAKIQKDVEEAKSAGESVVGEGVMGYLNEISLYINNSCAQNCSFCKNAYKQFLVCTRSSSCSSQGGRRSKPIVRYKSFFPPLENLRKKTIISHIVVQELEIEKIKQFVRQAEGSSIFRLNILGGDIFTYSKFAELVPILNNLPILKKYYSHYLNLIDRTNELRALRNDLSYVNVLIHFPVSQEKLEKAAALCAETGMNYEFVFVVQKEEEIDTAQEISSRLKIADLSFKPFYNQKNFDFFKKNIFVNKEELLLTKPGLKDIFSRTKVNPLSFGKVTVLSNGIIYANVSESKIGVLGRDSLYDVVLKEMYDGRSWRKPRSKVAPCKSCTYCFLCPPLTNYEYALKRNNLCNIWPDF